MHRDTAQVFAISTQQPQGLLTVELIQGQFPQVPKEGTKPQVEQN